MHGEMEEQRKRRDNKRGAIFCTKMQKKRKKIETRRRYTERYRKNVWMWSRGSCKLQRRRKSQQETRASRLERERKTQTRTAARAQVPAAHGAASQLAS
jgi:hypothetical protein